MELTLTDAGMQAAQNMIDRDILFNPVTFSLGSGYGYMPARSQTLLQGTIVYTGNFQSRGVVTPNQSQYFVQIPPGLTSITWGELGLFSPSGVLLAVGTFPALHTKTPSTNLYLQIEWGQSVGITDASTTSTVIGTGVKSFAVSPDMSYYTGEQITVYNKNDRTQFMRGPVVSYSGTTLTMTSVVTGGSGTVATWGVCNTINLLFEDYLINRILFLESYAFVPKYSTSPTNNYICIPPDSTPVFGGGYGNYYGLDYGISVPLGASIKDHSDLILKGSTAWAFTRYPFKVSSCVVAANVNGFGQGYGYSYGATS